MVGFLSQQQQDILLGLLLGDGSLEFNGYQGTRLQIKQSVRKQEYVLWLYDQFKEYVSTPPQQRLDTKQWYFATRSMRDFTLLYEQFYPGGIKTVPSTISDMFQNPLTLAIWYMDDGSLDFREKYHYSFSLSTDAFSRDEVELLQQILQVTFNIEASIQQPSSRGKRYCKLYIGVQSRDRFLDLIQPHIVRCFNYKLPPREYHNLTPQRLIPSWVK